MNRCIQTIRPDLGTRSAPAISLSICGQILFILTHKDVVLHFGTATSAETGPAALAEPVADFVLRGLCPT